MFVDCPAYLDNSGPVRCGLPAEIEGNQSGPLLICGVSVLASGL